jgi:carbonic anhydrase/acetyltransferase-like protein (isoleucine patch superfamily)
MIYELGNVKPQFKGDHFIADNAAVIGSVILENDVSVWFNCVLRGDTDELLIGEGTNIQDFSMLHTDPGIKLRIGRDCVIGHHVVLHGCEVGDNSLIGIGAVILNRAKIGRNCIVGARSLVTEGKSFPDNSMIMGTPAKVVREVTPQEVQMIKLNAQHYVQNFKRFLRDLKAAKG